ncbi:FAD-binding protein [Staphylococcus sp. GDY8P72P]|uniref:L-aspartate oxidase n=1 Tax=Staphylococcus sp. GDY8P72P TaxID=2804425 RepID=UPI00194E20FF|nr:FAD-binding protein [Staphylococcus sp. GDY8P72P]
MKRIILIGSGLAALSFIEALEEYVHVICLTKDSKTTNNSYLAQGGICFSKYEHDSGASHAQDTYEAGHLLGDQRVITSMICASYEAIQKYINQGINFDRQVDTHDFDWALEGAHTVPRILHIGGDRTGYGLMQHLTACLTRHSHITTYEQAEVIDLVHDRDGKICGVYMFDQNNELQQILGHEVVCATGGYSNIFRHNSHAASTVSSGHIIAFHHGVPLRHMEMIQFHPTLLGTPTNNYGLISEAVRGEGGILKNAQGVRFMDDYHPLGSLAPRDITSRAIFEQHQQCYIDIRQVRGFKQRFPGIYQQAQRYCSDDYSQGYLPVTVGAHYTMGGIKTDLAGRTNLPHFYCIGEASNTNFHGANRLASNSLLEAIVMGQHCAAVINQQPSRPLVDPQPSLVQIPKISEAVLKPLQAESEAILGIERHGACMTGYLTRLHQALEQAEHITLTQLTPTLWQRYVRVKMLEIICEAALHRTESRGAHYRLDKPKMQTALQQIDIEIVKGEDMHAQHIKRTRENQTVLPGR